MADDDTSFGKGANHHGHDGVSSNGVTSAELQMGLETARDLLSRLPESQVVPIQHKAHYHLIQGVVLLSEQKFSEARQHFVTAASHGFDTEDEASVLQCSLAQLAVRLGDFESARQHLSAARALEHKTDISIILDDLENQLRLDA